MLFTAICISNPGSQITFNSHVFLGPFDVEPVLSLPLSFMTSTLPNLGLSHVSSLLDSDDAFWPQCPRRDNVSFSVHLILRHTLWVDFIVENKDIDHLVKVVLIRFSTVKLLFSLLWLISTSVGGILSLGNYTP